MTYLALFLMCVAFVEMFWLLRVMSNAREIISSSQVALETISSTSANDSEKATAARGSSFAILKQTMLIIVKFAIVSSGLAIPGIVFIQLNWVSPEDLVETAFSLSTFVGLTIFTVLYVKIRYVCGR